MKRLFFLLFIGLFLCNPAYLNAASWEYSAYGEVYNHETDTRYNVTGNMIIDDTFGPWLGYGEGWQYRYDISRYSIHLTEQWGSEHYYFYGAGGYFYMEFYNMDVEWDRGDFQWRLSDGFGKWNDWYGEEFDFYHSDGTPYYPEEYKVLAPQIWLGGQIYAFGINDWPHFGGNIALTRTGPVQVPEPATGMLFAISIASVVFWRRKLR